MDLTKKIFLLYLLALLTYLLYTLSPGPWITDEATYLLMVDALKNEGSLQIWNGFDEIHSP